MKDVYELGPAEVRQLLDALGVTQEITQVYSLRVTTSDGGFKASVNRGTWSPPMGKEYK